MKLQRSSIGWTDFSGGPLNFALRGSAPGDCEVSPGCANCYAGAILRRSGSKRPATTYSEAKLSQLLSAEFPAPKHTCEQDDCLRRGPGSRPLAFVCDMGDLFHPAVPDSLIARAIQGFCARSDVDWQILTKRPERMLSMFRHIVFPQNVWLGVTAENQEQLDVRGPMLLSMMAAVRFLSVEPMLGPIAVPFLEEYSWVICGAESGPNRRPFDPAWAHDLLAQCRAAGPWLPFFAKQASGLRPGTPLLIDGAEVKEFPK